MEIHLRERAILSLPAVFELLYDSARLDESQLMIGRQEIEELCQQLQPPTAMAQALKIGLQQQQGA